jgi:hypothetical protein
MLAKLIFTISAVLILHVIALSQQPCSKTVSQAPPMFGFTLGMSFENFRSVLGRTLKIKPKKNGEGSFFLDFNEQPPPDNLIGVKAAYVRFFNGNVYQIEVFYNDKDQAIKLEDFTNHLSVDFGLPSQAWSVKSGQAEMNCDGFMLTADVILNRHIELTDVAAKAEFDKKREAVKVSKKKTKS